MPLTDHSYRRKAEYRKLFACAELIDILKQHDDEAAIRAAEVALRQALGNGWTKMAAMQFFSGATCAALIQSLPDDGPVKVHLYAMHLGTKEFCATNRVASVDRPDGIDYAQLKMMLDQSSPT